MKEKQENIIKLSIVVPVYNVLEFIDRCLSSLINKYKENVEILLIDDGSTDGSGEKCDQYAEKYPYISSYHKENGGLASARNYGLDRCKGDFVIFVDSDDWVSNNMLNFVENHVNDTIDVVKYGFQKVRDGEYKDIHTPYYDEGVYNKTEIENILLPGMIGPYRLFDYSKVALVSACTCIYRRKFLDINSIRFKSEREILNEDTLFNYEVMLKAEKIEVTHEILYYYDFREGSLSKRKVVNMLQRKKALFKEEKQLLLTMNYWDKYQTNYYSSIVDSYYGCVINECSVYSELKNESLQNIKKILNEEQCIEALKKCNHKNLSLKGFIIYWLMRIKAGKTMYYLYKGIKK